ncbi:hypothetical protein LIER_25868 [Lithospermum erythrorhizon]|uniref:Reverse transcriptase domain-containing protein n=1 Tax=Lithospermum erythrorhizon TaxID=34254 RepID=A0AAV3R7W2_LITER
MVVFAELMGKRALQSEFDFHPKCKEFGLTTVSFADDMMIMYGANVKTVQTVRSVLEYFGNLSGLKPNFGKSIIYIAGLEDSEAQKLSKVLGIGLRKLPDICNHKESLWIKWVAEYRLKGLSIWSIKPKSTDSWTWRPYVKMVVGDGKDTSFWYDCWHKKGILVDKLSDDANNKLRVPEGAKVEEVMMARSWPKGRHLTNEIRDMIRELNSLQENVRDHVSWQGNENENVVKTSSIWRTLNPLKPELPWGELFGNCWCTWEITELLGLGKRNSRTKSFCSRLRKTWLWCVVYEVWRERNNRLFDNAHRDTRKIITIRGRVNSWKISRNKLNRKICVEWGFPLEILI